MKKIALLKIFVFMGAIAMAQVNEEGEYYTSGTKDREFKTLFGEDFSAGGYGGFSIRYNKINDKDAVSFGGQGLVIFSHWWAMGIAGNGFVTDLYTNSNDVRVNISGGYGGLIFEPILLPNFPVHLSVPLMGGFGGIAYSEYEEIRENAEFNVIDATSFLVFEPGLELEFNLTNFFRLSFGAYYRLTTDVDIEDIQKDALNGFSGGVTFKFGKF